MGKKKSKFKNLAAELEAKGAKDPNALATWIGRKKYGTKKFAAMGKAGRRKRK
jgi:hypothetical protein